MGLRPLGPVQTGPRCFILLVGRTFNEAFLTGLDGGFDPRRHGAVFMTDDPDQAGTLLRVVTSRDGFAGAFQAATGAGWTIHCPAGSHTRAVSLVGTIRPGDVWASVVYTDPVTNDRHARPRRPSAKHSKTYGPPLPTVYYGCAPLPAEPVTNRITAAEASDRSPVFFRQLIASHNL